MNTVLVSKISPEVAQKALGEQKADIIYSDTPWGPGNLRYWSTHNNEELTFTWDTFLDTLARTVHATLRPGGHLFLEMGTRWIEELATVMAQYGFPETKRWQVLYGNPKRPNYLWYSGPEIDVDPTGLSGVRMTKTVLQAVSKPGALVFDPCCGKGMTARCAVRLGMRFVGVEMNPKRAAVTQEWLERNSDKA